MDIHASELNQYQRSSSELVVFSRLAERAVQIAYPTYNHQKILPTGLFHYLRARGVFFECWCAFQADAGMPRSCRIVVSKVTGNVFAFCHFEHDRCGFKLNLTDIFKTSLLKSSYNGFPTLESGAAPADMEILLVAFTLQGFPAQEIAPYFEGYLGEHISKYPPGTRQLGGTLLFHRPRKAVTTRGRHATPYHRPQKQAPTSNAYYFEIDDLHPRSAPARMIASSSRIPLDHNSNSVSCAGPSKPNGSDYHKNLAAGKGVDHNVFNDMFERCRKCGLMFTVSALRLHSERCLGFVDLD
ncbi:hypothetical protein K438DRAFT_2027418 [Mycena galopus ATCC 62051]|nr:hypothetical protein K438DRAFT_2027418 [Mycena galopus ATCC 62051]